jgi:hypothetical protein
MSENLPDIIIPASPSSNSASPEIREPAGSKLTVVEQIYHHSPTSGSYSLDCRSSRSLKTDEQPYSRRMKVDEQWQKIDIGWVEKPSLVVVENREGQFMQVQPTKEEREATAKKVLEFSFAERRGVAVVVSDPDVLIHPGTSFRFCPAMPCDMLIRCQSGEAKVSVTAFPE